SSMRLRAPVAPVVLSSLDATETQAIAAQPRKTAAQNAVGRAKTASRGDKGITAGRSRKLFTFPNQKINGERGNWASFLAQARLCLVISFYSKHKNIPRN